MSAPMTTRATPRDDPRRGRGYALIALVGHGLPTAGLRFQIQRGNQVLGPDGWQSAEHWLDPDEVRVGAGSVELGVGPHVVGSLERGNYRLLLHGEGLAEPLGAGMSWRNVTPCARPRRETSKAGGLLYPEDKEREADSGPGKGSSPAPESGPSEVSEAGTKSESGKTADPGLDPRPRPDEDPDQDTDPEPIPDPKPRQEPSPRTSPGPNENSPGNGKPAPPPAPEPIPWWRRFKALIACGAATAVILVVILVVLLDPQPRDDGRDPPPVVQPPDPGPGSPPVAVQPQGQQPGGPIVVPIPPFERARQRVDSVAAGGDRSQLLEAERLFGQAERDGDARGAFALGELFDPRELSAGRIAQLDVDIESAYRAYRQALDLGHERAAAALRGLREVIETLAKNGDSKAIRLLERPWPE